MIRNAQEFGAAVAQARKSLGLNQRELALAINSGERFIVDREAGDIDRDETVDTSVETDDTSY